MAENNLYNCIDLYAHKRLSELDEELNNLKIDNYQYDDETTMREKVSEINEKINVIQGQIAEILEMLTQN